MAGIGTNVDDDFVDIMNGVHCTASFSTYHRPFIEHAMYH
jgi:hypothetical protein